jgi:hypothetical protein
MRRRRGQRQRASEIRPSIAGGAAALRWQASVHRIDAGACVTSRTACVARCHFAGRTFVFRSWRSVRSQRMHASQWRRLQRH